MGLAEWMAKLAVDVYYGEGDTDHPDCPTCGGRMNFFGGDRAHGEGYWKCSSCGFSVTEDDLEGE